MSKASSFDIPAANNGDVKLGGPMTTEHWLPGIEAGLDRDPRISADGLLAGSGLAMYHQLLGRLV
jgi:hypothetical protein